MKVRKDSDEIGINILIIVPCHQLLDRTDKVKKFIGDFNNLKRKALLLLLNKRLVFYNGAHQSKKVTGKKSARKRNTNFISTKDS